MPLNQFWPGAHAPTTTSMFSGPSGTQTPTSVGQTDAASIMQQPPVQYRDNWARFYGETTSHLPAPGSAGMFPGYPNIMQQMLASSSTMGDMHAHLTSRNPGLPGFNGTDTFIPDTSRFPITYQPPDQLGRMMGAASSMTFPGAMPQNMRSDFLPHGDLKIAPAIQPLDTAEVQPCSTASCNMSVPPIMNQPIQQVSNDLCPVNSPMTNASPVDNSTSMVDGVSACNNVPSVENKMQQNPCTVNQTDHTDNQVAEIPSTPNMDNIEKEPDKSIEADVKLESPSTEKDENNDANQDLLCRNNAVQIETKELDQTHEPAVSECNEHNGADMSGKGVPPTNACKSVTVEEACQGIIKAITYLEAHPSIMGDHVPMLRDILQHLAVTGVQAGDGKPGMLNSDGGVKLEGTDDVDDGCMDGDDSGEDDPDSGSGDKKRLSSCVMCNEDFDTSEELERHMNIHEDANLSKKNESKPHKRLRKKKKKVTYGDVEPTETEESLQEMPETMVKPTVTEHTEKSKINERKISENCPRCVVCGKVYTRVTHLRRHMQTHAGEIDAAQSNDILNEINRSIQPRRRGRRPKDGPHSCEVCKKIFRQGRDLTVHMRIHSGEKPYTCDVCGKCFAQAGAVRIHMPVHFEERPHKCTICDKTFRHRQALYHHKHVHSSEKPYLCSLCGKSFSTVGNLNSHKVYHSEKMHPCDTCGQKFSKKCDLKNHKIVHTGEKPYQCKICGKDFGWARNRTAHMKSAHNL